VVGFKSGDEELPAPRIRMGDIGAPIDMWERPAGHAFRIMRETPQWMSF
jgi:hypothetical protein